MRTLYARETIIVVGGLNMNPAYPKGHKVGQRDEGFLHYTLVGHQGS